MKTIGLTLGKYAPFHRGHQYLFDTALAEVDELVVLIYDTSVIRVPLSIRARWIRQLYPQVTVIECWDGPEGYSSERAFEMIQEQYILKMLNGRMITHFYSSEFYGDHVSRALEALDRRVDSARETVPISATLIRENPWQYRHFVADVVYRDLITKVVLLGAMSTGKSTLAEALAQKFQTTFVPEYGREYWTQHQVDRRIDLEAFEEIAIGHQKLEEAALQQANRYLFIDTNAMTTYLYALDYHGRAPEKVKQMALENAQRYDLFFLCDTDIPYDDTWDRSGDQKRQVFQKQIIADLHERRIPFILLRGTVAERVASVKKVLEQFESYGNYFGARG
jgi:NadR type nicotinamide-nucleotide adenylyltransferase